MGGAGRKKWGGNGGNGQIRQRGNGKSRHRGAMDTVGREAMEIKLRNRQTDNEARRAQ